MSTRIRPLLPVLFALLGLAPGAVASHEGLRTKLPPLSGSFEAGTGYSVTPSGPSGTQWFVDSVQLQHAWEIGDKTKIVVRNAFAAVSPGAGPGLRFNGASYFSSLTLSSIPTATPTAGGFLVSNLAAYLQHEVVKNLFFTVGNLRTPLGLESMSDRFDQMTYYYSAGYQLAQVYGWNYDLGAKLQLIDTIPGSLELAVLDGRQGPSGGPASSTPALVARYHLDIKSSAFTITPVFSTILGKWRGGPDDIGVTGGVLVSVGAIWLNTEAYFTSSRVPAGKNEVLSIMVEPGIDLGVAELSLKYNLVRVSATAAGAPSTTHNIAASVGKTMESGFRIRATYQYLQDTALNPRLHDFRLLFGAKF